MKKIIFGIAFLLAAVSHADLRPAVIFNSSTLQTGATFYTSSGTATNFNTTTLKFADGTSQTTSASGSHLMQAPVQFTTSASSATTVTSFVPTNITVSITPTSASSKVLINVSAMFSTQSTTVGAFGIFSVFRGSTNLGNASFGFGYTTNYVTSATTPNDNPIAFTYIDSPATTSATTYTVYFQSQASETVTFSRAGTPSIIILEEVQ